MAEIIARHPDIGFVSNVDDKLALLDLAGRWNPALFRRSAAKDHRLLPFRDRGRLLEWGRLRVSPSEAWNLLDRQVQPFFSTPCRDLVAADLTPWVEQRLHAFVERRLAAQRTPHLVLHLTGWPRTGLLQAAFPDGQAYHPSDLSATVYTALGIDPRLDYRDTLGRPFQASGGNVIEPLF